MKQTYSLIAALLLTAIAFAQQPVITAILDGSCTGGQPKAIEIFADGEVDFSLYSIGKSQNGGAFSSSSSLSSFGTLTGAFVYIVDDKAKFITEFPNVADANILVSTAASINGNDPVRITLTASGDVVDQYGFVNSDAQPFTWDFEDSYAKRVNGTGPDGNFIPANWTINSPNTLDNQGLCNSGDLLSLVISAGSYSTTTSTDPTLNVTGVLTNLDYFQNNGPSDEGTFTIAGTNLTGDVTITSSIFSISLTSGSGFVKSIVVSPSSGTVANTAIYAILPAGLTPADYAEAITITSTGATAQEVNASGTVTADDAQVTITANLENLQYGVGNGPSGSEKFTVSGLFLNTAGITVAVPTPFEISITETGTYTQTLSLTPDVNGTVSDTDIFIRLSANQSIGDFTETLTATATGATDRTLNVSGSVVAAANCAPAGSIIITEIMKNPSVVGDDTGEYFELYNTTANAIDIQSWIFKDDITATEMHVVASSVIIAPGAYVVMAKSATDNGGLTPAYVYGGSGNLILGNSTDGIIIECGGTEIDKVIYDNTNFPNEAGKSMELSVTKLNATDNDLGANWGSATTTFGAGDSGTPGTANNFTLSVNSSQKLTFSLYPNPITSGNLNIRSSNGNSFDVEIYSTLGQRVISQKSVSRSVNIDQLSSGLYIVKITQGSASQTRKLVVK